MLHTTEKPKIDRVILFTIFCMVIGSPILMIVVLKNPARYWFLLPLPLGIQFLFITASWYKKKVGH